LLVRAGNGRAFDHCLDTPKIDESRLELIDQLGAVPANLLGRDAVARALIVKGKTNQFLDQRGDHVSVRFEEFGGCGVRILS
jgi:hypothetical protein